MIQIYRLTLKEIEATLAAIYKKYATAGTLTYSEMQRYNRLAALEKEIDALLNQLGVKIKTSISRLDNAVFQNAYYRQSYEIDNILGSPVGFRQLNNTAIQSAINFPVAGETISKTLRRHTFLNKEKVKQQIIAGLIRGESYGQIAKRVKQVMNRGVNSAILTARTESHRLQILGQTKSIQYAQEKGVDAVPVWLATLDERTRSSHQQMDGQEADKEGMFELPGGIKTAGPGLSGIAEEDINCRCDIITKVDGELPTERRTREGVVEWTNYNEWSQNRNMPIIELGF